MRVMFTVGGGLDAALRERSATPAIPASAAITRASKRRRIMTAPIGCLAYHCRIRMSSKAAVALTDGSWLVNAMPKYTVDDMPNVVVPTVVQLTPSEDHWPVNVLPLRISRAQPGAEPGM